MMKNSICWRGQKTHPTNRTEEGVETPRHSSLPNPHQINRPAGRNHRDQVDQWRWSKTQKKEKQLFTRSHLRQPPEGREEFSTEATITADSEKNYNYCVYDSDIATGYGVGAFLFLLLSQVIMMLASSCFCCGKALKPGGSRACAVMLFILCWIVFLIAEACLLAGSVTNAYHTKYRTIFGGGDPPSCETVRKGVFAAGAAFVFFTCIVSQFYYVSFSNARGSFDAYGSGGEAGVGMAAYR